MASSPSPGTDPGWLLADRTRTPVRLLTGALLLAALVHWAALGEADLGYGGLARDPAAHDGEHVVLTLVRVEELVEKGFTVSKGTLGFTVHGPSEGLHPGDEISLEARVRGGDGVLELRWWAAHPDRARKRWLGALVVLATLLGLPFFARPDPDGWRLRG